MDSGNYQTVIQIVFNEDKSKATALQLYSIYVTIMNRNRISHFFTKLVSMREFVCNFEACYCGVCLWFMPICLLQ